MKRIVYQVTSSVHVGEHNAVRLGQANTNINTTQLSLSTKTINQLTCCLHESWKATDHEE